MNKNKGFTKSIAFTLVMAMLFATLSFGGMAGLPGVGGVEAYGAESITATVRIEGYDSTFLPPTEVNMPAGATVMDAINAAISGEGIDISMSGVYIDSISKGGIIWAGNDPRFKPEDNTAYNMSGWTYRINNQSYNLSVTEKTISSGEQISLVYGGYGDYGYFPEWLYYGVEGQPVNVKLYSSSWFETIVLGDAFIHSYVDNEVYGQTDSNGFASISFTTPGTYEITASKMLEGYTASEGSINLITRPYAKVIIIPEEDTYAVVDSDAAQLSLFYDGKSSEIALPSIGSSGASISWESSDINTISVDGQVKRPNYGQDAKVITLTAIIGNESYYSKTKDFQINVLPYTEEELNETLNKMETDETPPLTVMSDKIHVSTYSWDQQIKFSWRSSRPDVIGETQDQNGYLQVTRPAIGEPDVEVTLTAIATSGDLEKEKSFSVLVVPPLSAEEKLQVLAIIENGIANKVSESGLITSHMTYGSEWIMGMVSSGNRSLINPQDKTNFLAMALEEIQNSNTTIGKKSKIVVALTALGIDPRVIPGQTSDEAINLIEQIYNEGPGAGFGGQYSIPYVLMVYNLGFTPDGFDRNHQLSQTIDKMAEIEGGTLENEVFYNKWAADTIGLYLSALAPHYGSNATAQGIVSRGIDWINANQRNGSFGNANSDAMVVLGLSGIQGNGGESESRTVLLDQMGSGLLSYKTEANDGFGYQGSFNLLSTVQGFWGVIAYQKYLNGSGADSYIFNYPTTGLKTDVDWPTEKFPLDIIVTPPTTIKFTKGAWIDASSLNFVVKATYLDGSTATIPNSLCTVSYLDTSTSGAKEISVSYLGKTKSFTVIVEDPATPVVPKEVTLTINGTSVSGKKIVIHNSSTVLSVLQEACGLYGIDILSYKGYVSSMNGLSEFDQGPNSGWLYQVNGNTPSTTGADQYKLTGGERVTWYYTKDFTKDASSSAWVTENQAGAVQNGLVSVTTDVKAVTGSDGTAKATVSTTQLDTAVSDALKAAAASKDGAKPAVTIAIEADSKAQGVETVIPKAAFANLVNKGIQQMTIASPLGNMTLDLETLKDIVKGGAGDISLSIKKAEESKGRPVIRLEINNGGKAVGTFSKPITITVPYNPAASENEQGIAVFHLDENGQWKNIKASKYDGKNKAIVFRTNHFSDFVIAYSHKTFGDIQGHWAQTPIEYLASRRIIQGMTEESFAPNGTITRAQFVTLLAGMAGADLNQYSLSRFNDVKDNAWYKGAVVWAAENGIVQGQQAADGSFWFNPNQNISRQDMAVVMMRYLAWAKEPAKETTKAIAFKDGSAIASYAKESVATMQKAGLINGRTTPDNQTVFDPAGKLTRAEAAQILTNQLYQQF
jgi:hypothetical protein